jgi:hypothetical protein
MLLMLHRLLASFAEADESNMQGLLLLFELRETFATTALGTKQLAPELEKSWLLLLKLQLLMLLLGRMARGSLFTCNGENNCQ